MADGEQTNGDDGSVYAELPWWVRMLVRAKPLLNIRTGIALGISLAVGACWAGVRIFGRLVLSGKEIQSPGSGLGYRHVLPDLHSAEGISAFFDLAFFAALAGLVLYAVCRYWKGGDG